MMKSCDERGITLDEPTSDSLHFAQSLRRCILLGSTSGVAVWRFALSLRFGLDSEKCSSHVAHRQLASIRKFSRRQESSSVGRFPRLGMLLG